MANADVLPPPTSTSDSPSESLADLARPKPRERIPSYAQNRMSTYSQSRRSSSRPQSSVIPAFKSSLDYTLVRDFAYPSFHPMHYGAPPDPPSGTTTPGSEWNGARRLSDPLDGANTTSTGWSAGPWGGDGMFGDPDQLDGGHDQLPSTSFGDEGSEAGDDGAGGSRKKHRKSKSYANISDYERGRRRESAGYRRSRVSGESTGANDMFMFSGQQSDPAGRDSLRMSRGYGTGQPGIENGGARRDSHFQTMLLNRTYPNNDQPLRTPNIDPENDMPLDSEPIHSPAHSPQRQSIGPEDEELYAGRSLALYAFEPENSNELRLREGQVIMVSYRHGQGWLVAEDPETGEQGLVPEEYVRLLSELPHYDEATGTFIDPDDAEADISELPGDTPQYDGLTESPEVVSGTEMEDSGVDSMGHSTKELRIDEAYSAEDLREGGVMMKTISR